MREILCSGNPGLVPSLPCPRVRAQAAAEAGNYNIPPRHHFLHPPWFILICLIFKPAPAAQPTFTNIPSLSHQKFTCCPNATGDATNETNFEDSASTFWPRMNWCENWTKMRWKCNCIHSLWEVLNPLLTQIKYPSRSHGYSQTRVTTTPELSSLGWSSCQQSCQADLTALVELSPTSNACHTVLPCWSVPAS